MSEQPAPIIIKRKKIIAGGHHGGAWKVAYADFVTAMMAFFLLMWLLGATNEKQRKGIADYFNPTIPVNKVSGGGSGAFGGDSVFTDSSLSQNGTGAALPMRSSPSTEASESIDEGDDSTNGQAQSDGSDPMEKMAKMFTARAGESMVSDLLERHIITKVTDEGLIVEIFDIPNLLLFSDGNEPTDELISLVAAVAEVFRLAENEIAVQGHMATVPLAARSNPVWEHSTARSNRVRELLVANAIMPNRIQRVTGFADRKPATLDPMSQRNNRLELILLRSE